MTTEMFKYIKTIIDDKYAMEVLYFSVRHALATNGYTLNGVNSIKISEKFLGEPVVININKKYSKRTEAFALLLSIKALLIDETFVQFCESDGLIFEDIPAYNFGWIDYISVITNCTKDEDFCNIYQLLSKAYNNVSLCEEDLEQFDKYTKAPEFKNITKYYETIAKQNSGVTYEVICNNAFVYDDTLVEYTVPSSIGYIGNTAFSFCEKLTKITIQNEHILFGVFPIIECNSLNRIIVPTGSEEYYKETLSYYKDIITSNGKQNENLDPSGNNDSISVLPQEVEHMYYDEETHEYVTKKEIDSRRKQRNNEELKQVETGQKENNYLKKPKLDFDAGMIRSVFDKKVTTYKYFWLLAIISLIKEKKTDTLKFKDIVIRMASIAWPLIFVDKLDFGSRDMMKKYLSSIRKQTTLKETTSSKSVDNYIRNGYPVIIMQTLKPLLANVPYRFLSPWIKYESDNDVIMKSNSGIYSVPYILNEDSITITKEWYSYFNENYDDVHQFAKESLINYLKQYNDELSLLGLMSKDLHII